MKKIIEVNIKCLKNLHEICKSDKTILEDRNLTIVIHDCVIWCFNILNELINPSTAKGANKPSRDQVKNENKVIYRL
jgi:hypothetical protein